MTPTQRKELETAHQKILYMEEKIIRQLKELGDMRSERIDDPPEDTGEWSRKFASLAREIKNDMDFLANVHGLFSQRVFFI